MQQLGGCRGPAARCPLAGADPVHPAASRIGEFSLHSTPRGAGGADRTRSGHGAGARALGTGPCWSRTRRRAAPAREEGLDLIPLAPKAEMDLAAAWRRHGLRQLKPTSSTPTTPTAWRWLAAVSMSRCRCRRGGGVAAGGLPAPVRALALEDGRLRPICASDAIRRIVVSDGIRGSAPHRHEGSISTAAAVPPAALHQDLWLLTEAPIVGTSPRWFPQGQRPPVDAATLVLPHVPDARFVIAGEGGCANAGTADCQHHLEKHVLLAGSGPTYCRCTRRSTCS